MHSCRDCGCDVFTLVDRNGYSIPECMGCGSTKPPIKTGVPNAPKEDVKRWNPKDSVDEFIGKKHWDDLRKEWLNEWNKRVGFNRNTKRN